MVMLANAPLRLSIKVGDKNVPISKLAAKTRSKFTQAAIRQPYLINTIMVITLAKPGLTPGIRLGNALSVIWIVMAKAANQAIR
jgi:hypothetical protein